MGSRFPNAHRGAFLAGIARGVASRGLDQQAAGHWIALGHTRQRFLGRVPARVCLAYAASGMRSTARSTPSRESSGPIVYHSSRAYGARRGGGSGNCSGVSGSGSGGIGLFPGLPRMSFRCVGIRRMCCPGIAAWPAI